MKNTQTYQKNHQRIVSVTCNCCKKVYTDSMDWQEFIYIDDHGGFNSAIGDGVHYQCDLCSNCVKKLLGEYLQITTDSEWEKCGSGNDTLSVLVHKDEE